MGAEGERPLIGLASTVGRRERREPDGSPYTFSRFLSVSTISGEDQLTRKRKKGTLPFLGDT